MNIVLEIIIYLLYSCFLQERVSMMIRDKLNRMFNKRNGKIYGEDPDMILQRYSECHSFSGVVFIGVCVGVVGDGDPVLAIGLYIMTLFVIGVAIWLLIILLTYKVIVFGENGITVRHLREKNEVPYQELEKLLFIDDYTAVFCGDLQIAFNDTDYENKFRKHLCIKRPDIVYFEEPEEYWNNKRIRKQYQTDKMIVFYSDLSGGEIW